MSHHVPQSYASIKERRDEALEVLKLAKRQERERNQSDTSKHKIKYDIKN